MHAFLTIALIHLLAVASPGPDFAIIVKQGITQSRKTVLWTACGLACGITLHVTYCLLGIGFIISQSILVYTVIKLVGAAYLLFIGWNALTAKKGSHAVDGLEQKNDMSVAQALRVGFLCNALNPKATLFFLALFTQVIDPHTPLVTQMGYGAYMVFQTFAWFSLLGTVLSAGIIRRHINAFHVWAERVMGVVLIALGIKVVLSTRE